MLNQSKYIKTIPFSGLFNWDAKCYLIDNSLKILDEALLRPFSYFTKVAKIEKVRIEDNEEYKILGVRSYGYGAYQNRISRGKDLKMKVYQQAKVNHLFWCKVDTKNGAFGIITEELADGLGSSNMTFAELDLTKISVDYLQLLFKSKILHSYMDNMVTGTTNRKYIKFSDLLSNVKIPLPSLAEQNALVAAYNNRITTADSQELQANIFEQQIEKDIFDRLKIKQQKIIESKGLQFSSLVELSVWGVEKLMSHSLNGILSSQIYPNKPLATIVLVNPITNIKPLADNDVMSFIPMECISDTYGEWAEKRVGEKLNSKGYTKFQDGDLIWARITPCMQNGKSAIVENLENGYGYGSTEFHVIRSINNNLNLKYIYTLLRLPSVLLDATKHFTGSAGQQRVPKSYLEMLNIPIPPLEVQNEIVTHITGLKEQIKQLRTAAITNRTTALTNFEQKIFG